MLKDDGDHDIFLNNPVCKVTLILFENGQSAQIYSGIDLPVLDVEVHTM